MRYLVLTALAIIIFMRFCDTKPVPHLPISNWQIDDAVHDSADTISSPHGYDSTIQDFTINNTEYYSGLKHCAGNECTSTPHIKAHSKTPSEAAELTLEYMAVQLPRSHAFQ